MSNIHISTFGWNYEHWEGRFYPEDLSEDDWLEHYQEQFDTVEVNNTFYNLPDPETLEDWRNRVPEDFTFVAKANR